ncbi:MAG: hypothetical protein RR140_03750 [Clostridia bacterium]
MKNFKVAPVNEEIKKINAMEFAINKLDKLNKKDYDEKDYLLLHKLNEQILQSTFGLADNLHGKKIQTEITKTTIASAKQRRVKVQKNKTENHSEKTFSK